MNPLRLNPVGLYATTPADQTRGMPPRHEDLGPVYALRTAKTSSPRVRPRPAAASWWAPTALPTIKEEEEGEESTDKKEEEDEKKEGTGEYVFRLGAPDLTVPVTRPKRSVWRSRVRRAWRFCTHFFVGTKMSGRARLVLSGLVYKGTPVPAWIIGDAGNSKSEVEVDD